MGVAKNSPPDKDGSDKDGDGYFDEDMKVEVGTFSLDTLDLGDEEEDKLEESDKTSQRASKKK